MFDASAVFPGFAPTQVSEPARLCLQTYDPVVIDFMFYETANALTTYARANKISPNVVRRIQAAIEGAFASESAVPFRPDALALAIRHHHAVYDCLYVACAMARDLPLVTADKKLARKFADVLSGRLVNLYDMPEHLP
ncbi:MULTISPECIES: type II toxin-antitoxin system VapC family toxin [unclassified Roseitalea]|uniref:type II toxin-antitoxin system VapC family toxin n=1 Tax=unclassified Roseitalea TaxID=2639107 RepID=UPI00273D5408|nr:MULTISPECIES: type II toxin-antitoxin system VapC family toxin [unclassified Roseitalea]